VQIYQSIKPSLSTATNALCASFGDSTRCPPIQIKRFNLAKLFSDLSLCVRRIGTAIIASLSSWPILFFNDTKEYCASPLELWYLDNTKPCSSDCSTSLRAGKSRLGCCFGTFFSFLDYQKRWEPDKYTLNPITPYDIRRFVDGKCDVGIPWGCAAQEVSAVILLKNFNTSYYQAHKADVDAILNATFAYILAINAVKITLMNIENATPQDFGHPLLATGATSSEGLKATITVNPTSNDETTRVVAALNNANDQQSANFVLSQLPLGAKVDPTLPLVAVTASSTTVNTSAGSSTFASFSLLLLLLLVCFF